MLCSDVQGLLFSLQGESRGKVTALAVVAGVLVAVCYRGAAGGCTLLCLRHFALLTSPPLLHTPSRPSNHQTIIQAARMKEDGKVRKVVVTGCLAQRYGAELADQLPEVDLMIG